MLTEVGKYLRKLRIDRGELLKDMADTIGVSSAYLSSIENGKREISDNLASSIAAAYDFDEEDAINFYNAIDVARQEIRLNLHQASRAKQELGLTFARKFDTLSDEDVFSISSILNRDKKE